MTLVWQEQDGHRLLGTLEGVFLSTCSEAEPSAAAHALYCCAQSVLRYCIVSESLQQESNSLPSLL